MRIRIPAPEHPPIRSLLGEIFHLWQRGDTTAEEYHLANATWVEKNTQAYVILRFPEPSPTVVEYVASRMNGRDFDGDRARALGLWFHSCLRTASENDSNLDTLRWAKEKLHTKGLPSDRINAVIDRADRVLNYDEFFLKAIEVKKRDAEIPVNRKRGGAA